MEAMWCARAVLWMTLEIGSPCRQLRGSMSKHQETFHVIVPSVVRLGVRVRKFKNP
jgi:hypothetical protein